MIPPPPPQQLQPKLPTPTPPPPPLAMPPDAQDGVINVNGSVQTPAIDAELPTWEIHSGQTGPNEKAFPKVSTRAPEESHSCPSRRAHHPPSRFHKCSHLQLRCH
eukprot:TRINITY_DN22606_c0_g1_i1.p1 TRINITY_DN22606_c0_g1~~TRINITY_DN22606_c0_g1_i1.p1  ORF type:complete len:105 (-),score=14.62 TRINITY_DN22606_c0_g1_i1:69-383(-)